MDDWQIITVVAIVLVAGAYVGWQTWRTWNPSSKGCGGGCGCDTPRPTKRSDLLTLGMRRRGR
jgi:hypothetical protein